ncbi:MAG: tyrosine-type recombinase/integrase [Thermonemataceae bacterium]
MMQTYLNEITAHEIAHFKVHLERLGYTKSTQEMLPRLMKSFFTYTAKKISEITAEDITTFYTYLHERPNQIKPGGLSESYIHHHVYALKVFFAWQEQKGTMSQNPMSTLAFKRPISKPRAILSLSEVKRLYEACENYQEKALLGLFYGCGLRKSEGEALHLKDIHFRSSLLYVRLGKGGRRRVIPLSEKVKIDLQNYAYKERPFQRISKRNASLEDQMAFMLNQRGKPMRGASYNRLLKVLLQRASISKEITLHGLRHSIATHLLASGLSLEQVRDFLGHKHLESTQVYTRIQSKQLWHLSNQ